MKTRLLLFISCILFIQNCAEDAFSSYQKRRGTAVDDNASTDTAVRAVSLVVDQSILNCSDNTKCHLEDLQNISQNDHSIKSLIVSEADIMTATNLNIAPSIGFSIIGIDESAIASVSYSYTKKDALGKIIVQTEDNIIYSQDGKYYIPIHSKTLGSGILNSVPYEQHILSLKIRSSDNNTYSDYINFYLLSKTDNPLIFERSTDITNSSYYKMDDVQNSFIIDSIDLKNTLGYAITIGGTINVYNHTVAFLSNIQKKQDKVFVPKEYYAPYYYNHDRYNWYTSSLQTYKTATGIPSYLLRIHRGTNTVEEIPTNIQNNNNLSSIYFGQLELQGYENIKIDLVAQFNFNNSLLGDHGQKNFYEGLSKCEDINEPEKCFCFYLPIKQSFYSEPAADLYYFIPDAMMLMLKSYIYPDCGTINTTFLFQGLVPTTYPETTLSLAGRHHLTNTSYSITSWLKNYEDLDPLGTTSKTMDPLESIKGFTDYTTIDMGESYQGYVPGTI